MSVFRRSPARASQKHVPMAGEREGARDRNHSTAPKSIENPPLGESLLCHAAVCMEERKRDALVRRGVGVGDDGRHGADEVAVERACRDDVAT